MPLLCRNYRIGLRAGAVVANELNSEKIHSRFYPRAKDLKSGKDMKIANHFRVLKYNTPKSANKFYLLKLCLDGRRLSLYIHRIKKFKHQSRLKLRAVMGEASRNIDLLLIKTCMSWSRLYYRHWESFESLQIQEQLLAELQLIGESLKKIDFQSNTRNKERYGQPWVH